MLEVLPRGASKGNGVVALLSYLGINSSTVLALGDAENDIEMLSLPGVVSVAMGHASDVVQSAACYVTKSNKDDGAARVLESIMLPEAPDLDSVY